MRDATMDREQKTVRIVVGFIFGMHLITNILTIAANGTSRLLPAGIGLVVNGGLCAALLGGAYWARWLLVLQCCGASTMSVIGVIALMRGELSPFQQTMLAYLCLGGVVYLAAGLALVFSPSIRSWTKRTWPDDPPAA